VGTLERTAPGKMRFCYDETVVTRFTDGTPLLSRSLPVQPNAFTPSQTRPFFEGLLPEGDARQAIAVALGLRARAADFELLSALGRDCAGAVVIVPDNDPNDRDHEHERPAAEREDHQDDRHVDSVVEWIDNDQVARRIEDLPRNPLGVELSKQGVRLSLAGVQPKLVLIRDAAGRWGLPTAGIPSTHIIKVPQLADDGRPRYEDIVVNELFCLRVLAEAGLSTARAERVAFGGRDTLVVERFDRTVDAVGRITRLHQEDCCQALGRRVDDKYDNGGSGVRLPQVIELVDTWTVSPARERLTLVDQVVANFTLGNADAHAKNLAFLYREPGLTTLAPLYDVVCTAAYPGLTTELALRIGGAVDSKDVGARAIQQMARDFGMSETATVRRASALAFTIANCAAAMVGMADAAGWGRPILAEIATVARQRAAQLARL
jgi:serine/threonine-protein kinase HipA